jgi:hypothetical protein
MDNLLANKRAVPYLASELEERLYLFTAWAEYGPLPWFCFHRAKDNSVPSPPQCFFTGLVSVRRVRNCFRVKQWPQELLRDRTSRLTTLSLKVIMKGLTDDEQVKWEVCSKFVIVHVPRCCDMSLSFAQTDICVSGKKLNFANEYSTIMT